MGLLRGGQRLHEWRDRGALAVGSRGHRGVCRLAHATWEPPKLAQGIDDLRVLREPALLVLGEDQLPIREHVVLALRAFLDRSLVSHVVQLGRETRGPHVVAVSDGAVLDQDARHDANLPLDGLELLEGLVAAVAVADRPARGGAEDVLEARLGRAAVRALERLALELDELRAAGLARRGWCEAGLAKLLAALRRDPVRRPRVVEQDLDLGLGPELADPLGHLISHYLERRAAEKGRRELDPHATVHFGPVLGPGPGTWLYGHAADDAEVDDRDRRDLRIGDLGQRLPDAFLGYHVAPAPA